MTYQKLYKKLSEAVNYNDLVVLDEQTNLYNFDFESKSTHILPGQKDYHCSIHEEDMCVDKEFENEIYSHSYTLNKPDAEIEENKKFRYHLFHSSQQEKSGEVIIMLHGFNEKYWDKYLPWAKRLNELTGKAVLLFPIAFHMNRAPALWSDPRAMHSITMERNKSFPHIQNSTFVNVAISQRLHLHPQRFIWSGIQTYNDIVQLIDEVRNGEHPIIDKKASFDLFAYSIGCLLAEILVMCNPKNYFDKSKVFLFCGGPTFTRLSPVSKFILDSEANVAIYSFMVEHLENYMKTDTHLAHYLSESHPEGIFLRSMINYAFYRKFREEAFDKIGKRMLAVGLENDNVIPSYEIVNTLKGVNHNLAPVVDVWNFPYPYKHEDPFPVASNFEEEIDIAFNKLMNRAAAFYKTETIFTNLFNESSLKDFFRKFTKF